MGGSIWHAPALEGIHELARRVQAAAHQERLLAHDSQGIFQQSCLVLDQRRRCHIRAELGGWSGVSDGAIASTLLA